jgi:DNA-binding LacI/PurR family transcriptional regulator
MIMTNRVTIKEVARAAGVSTQTVSRVVNDRPDVSPGTRLRVQDVIERLGYRPSAVARSLIQQRSYTLGVITAGLKYIGPSMILNGMTGEAEELGYALLLKELPRFEADDIEPIFQSLIARHVDGIIWAVPEVGDNQRWLKQFLPALPVPFIFLTAPPHSDLPSVDYDNYRGGRIATQHLLEQGFRHIGHVSGPLEWLSARQRKDGWQDALRDVGIEVPPSSCVEGNWSSGSGERAFTQLLEQYPEMDAVFVANDQMAIGVLQVACREGIKVPQELGVVGFDGLVESAYYWPPLTTVFQDLHALGCTAVKELVEIIESRWRGAASQASERILLQPELVIRESSVKRV